MEWFNEADKVELARQYEQFHVKYMKKLSCTPKSFGEWVKQYYRYCVI